jgi:hypothetical protein
LRSFQFTEFKLARISARRIGSFSINVSRDPRVSSPTHGHDTDVSERMIPIWELHRKAALGRVRRSGKVR